MPIMVKRQRWRARSRITLGGKREKSGALDTSAMTVRPIYSGENKYLIHCRF